MALGRYTIKSVSLDGKSTQANEGVQEFQIERNYWFIQPAGQRFDVIHSNNKAAALRSGGQTYFAEFSMSSDDALVILLRRENSKQVYRFDLKMASRLAETV